MTHLYETKGGMKMKKRFLAGLLIGLSLVCLVGMADAALIDSGSISFLGSTVGTFKDTSTGLTWLDLNSFYGWTSGPFSGESYNTWQSKLSGTDFHIATVADMAELVTNAPAVPAQWLSDATVMGAATTPRQLIWGLFDDGTTGTYAAWEWKYSDDTSWNTSHDVYDKNSAVGNVNPSLTDRDLGIWTVSNNVIATVPVPSAILLFGPGLAGLAALRKRFNY
jgi:hypothetical protein